MKLKTVVISSIAAVSTLLASQALAAFVISNTYDMMKGLGLSNIVVSCDGNKPLKVSGDAGHFVYQLIAADGKQSDTVTCSIDGDSKRLGVLTLKTSDPQKDPLSGIKYWNSIKYGSFAKSGSYPVCSSSTTKADPPCLCFYYQGNDFALDSEIPQIYPEKLGCLQ